MMSEEESKVVCVTGASGYIASWLVKLLLERGYTVKATVLDTDDPKQVQHLLALAGAKERLQLFKADLLVDGSFDPVIVPGCHAVFHTASPCFFECSDPQAELIEPAVKGTLNVLRACAKVASIKRVVITSSLASVLYNGKPLTSDVIVDETWYSDPVVCKDSKRWYPLSKTLAEQAAWVFAKQNGINLVTLHPGIVVGPLLQPTLNLSVEMILDLFNDTGKNAISAYMIVDVRDVADAHIRALETPSTSGRYCLVERVAHVSEASKMLLRLYPMSKCKDDIPCELLYQVSKERALTLGINFTPMEESLRDTIESLKEKGFLRC